jgi:FAD/FMN-containing dehydrogenase
MLRLDGAYSRVGEEETAFSGARTPRFGVFILGISPDPDVLAADRTWVRATWDARQPDAPDLGGYVNAHAEFGDRVHAIYGTEYARLAQIKASYDPDNVFHHNANITPASQ